MGVFPPLRLRRSLSVGSATGNDLRSDQLQVSH